MLVLAGSLCGLSLEYDSACVVVALRNGAFAWRQIHSLCCVMPLAVSSRWRGVSCPQMWTPGGGAVERVQAAFTFGLTTDGDTALYLGTGWRASADSVGCSASRTHSWVVSIVDVLGCCHCGGQLAVCATRLVAVPPSGPLSLGHSPRLDDAIYRSRRQEETFHANFVSVRHHHWETADFSCYRTQCSQGIIFLSTFLGSSRADLSRTKNHFNRLRDFTESTATQHALRSSPEPDRAQGKPPV